MENICLLMNPSGPNRKELGRTKKAGLWVLRGKHFQIKIVWLTEHFSSSKNPGPIDKIVISKGQFSNWSNGFPHPSLPLPPRANKCKVSRCLKGAFPRNTNQGHQRWSLQNSARWWGCCHLLLPLLSETKNTHSVGPYQPTYNQLK